MAEKLRRKREVVNDLTFDEVETILALREGRAHVVPVCKCGGDRVH
jgi:hypothetical protein